MSEIEEQSESPYSTPEEFAERLRVTRAHVYSWLKQGLPSIPIGGRQRRIVTVKAEAWLANGGAIRKRSRAKRK